MGWNGARPSKARAWRFGPCLAVAEGLIGVGQMVGGAKMSTSAVDSYVSAVDGCSVDP